MGYEISNPQLKAVYDRYRADSVALRDIASDIALLRALIEASVEANADNPTKTLKTVEGSLSVLLKLESKLLALDIERSHVLQKDAVVKLGDRIVELLSESLQRYAPDAYYDVVDDVAPKIAGAIVDARNTDDQ